MYTFTDQNGYEVHFSFQQGTFKQEANHVLVLCRFQESWLLTKHPLRGIECPGGKKEPGETLEQAAVREVREETGAAIARLQFIGEYRVMDPKCSFLKAVFFAEVTDIEAKLDYLETNGPYFETKDLLKARFQPAYSFLMKDKVMDYAMAEIQKKGLV